MMVNEITVMILSIGFDVRLRRPSVIRRAQGSKTASIVTRKLYPSVRLRRLHSEREQQDSETLFANSSIETKEPKWTELFTSLSTTQGGSNDEEKTLIIRALKLAMLTAEKAPIEFPVMGRMTLQKSISVASALLSLFNENNPHADHEIIATSLIVEQVWKEHLPLEIVKSELNTNIFELTRDVIQIRQMIEDIDMIDDISAGNCQKSIFSQFNKRSILLEFIAKLDCLRYVHLVPYDVQVPLALDCMYVHVAIGRLLQLPGLSSEMEERCMRILFPTSYSENKDRFNISMFQGQGAFRLIRHQLQKKIEESEELADLMKGVEMKTRVKTTSSFMRKLLSLSNLSKGGKTPEEVFDTLGVRVIVYPLDGMSSEEYGIKACYLIQDIASKLWPQIEGRAKDYIIAPKQNGYQSLHSTHMLQLEEVSSSEGEEDYILDEISPKDMLDASVEDRSKLSVRSHPIESVPDGPWVIDDPSKLDAMTYEELVSDVEYGASSIDSLNEPIAFELQIRTKQMDIEAESGSSSHARYKSGLNQTDYA
eukprot:g8693.t1